MSSRSRIGSATRNLTWVLRRGPVTAVVRLRVRSTGEHEFGAHGAGLDTRRDHAFDHECRGILAVASSAPTSAVNGTAGMMTFTRSA